MLPIGLTQSGAAHKGKWVMQVPGHRAGRSLKRKLEEQGETLVQKSTSFAWIPALQKSDVRKGTERLNAECDLSAILGMSKHPFG